MNRLVSLGLAVIVVGSLIVNSMGLFHSGITGWQNPILALLQGFTVLVCGIHATWCMSLLLSREADQ